MAVFELEESNYVGLADEDSVFEATVTNVALRTLPFKDKDSGQEIKQLDFTFVVDEPDSPFDSTKIYGKTGVTFNTHPDCKLRNWAQAILASELPAGYRLDTDELVGNNCRIIVGIDTWTDKTTGEEKSRNKVKSVMPSREAASDDAPF